MLGPALDGGYTLIGLSRAHPGIFTGIPWSTPQVYERTVERAREMRLPVVNVPQWYDIDDGDSLRLLEAELAGRAPALRGSRVSSARRHRRRDGSSPPARFALGEVRIVTAET